MMDLDKVCCVGWTTFISSSALCIILFKLHYSHISVTFQSYFGWRVGQTTKILAIPLYYSDSYHIFIIFSRSFNFCNSISSHEGNFDLVSFRLCLSLKNYGVVFRSRNFLSFGKYNICEWKLWLLHNSEQHIKYRWLILYLSGTIEYHFYLY